MPRTSLPVGRTRREAIVEAAYVAFAAQGYHRASLRQIAEQVGVSAGAIFRHFANKEELLVAVLEHWRRETDAHMAPHESDYPDSLGKFRALAGFHVQNRGVLELFIMLSAEATSPEHPAHDFIVDRYERIVGYIADGLRRGIRAGTFHIAQDDVEFQARMLVAVLDGLELQWLLDPQMDLVAAVDSALDVLIYRWSASPTDAVQPRPVSSNPST